MTALRPAGSTFLRVGGRAWHWARHAAARGKEVDRDPDDYIACPFDFVEVPGLDAEATVAHLRADHPRKTPVLFGSPHEAAMLFHRHAFGVKPAAEWLREADKFDLDAWFAQRVADDIAWQARSGKIVPRRGPWPDKARTYTSLTVPFEVITPDPKDSVIIGMLPTSDATETAAYLGFGGWNDCPPTPVHILLARQWYDRFGAIQVSNTYEQVEFQVAKPLTDRETALRLALDQHHWCSDSVPETLQVAAAELIDSSVWVFWWD
jgi:hypothetical protein